MRIKVHFHDDTRYIMLTPDVAFESFVERVKEKFAIRAPVKMRTKDEGDLITMGDKDDWEMAIGAVKRDLLSEMRRTADDGGSGSGSDSGMGKMEVWVQDAV